MVKISSLPTDSLPTATDYIIVNDSETGATKKVLLSSIFTLSQDYVPWEKLGKTTLGANGDTITVNLSSSKKYLMCIMSVVNTGSIRIVMQFNGDTGSNYAQRDMDNGTAVTNTSQTSLNLLSNAAVPGFGIVTIENISNKEKLLTSHVTTNGAAGASNAPSAKWVGGKWVNTSSQITSITISNTSTGDYVIGSEMVLYGHD